MRVLYHLPSLDSIYAQRTIYHGYRNAFLDLGHEFRPLTADDDLSAVYESFRPQLFITSTHHFYRKYLDYRLLGRLRERGLFTLTKIDFWTTPMSRARINEAPSLKEDSAVRRLIDDGLMGDAFFHVVEQGDARMEGFEAATGRKYHTIPLAADRTVLRPLRDDRFSADISYVGSNLPEKRAFFASHVNPLRRDYDVRVYGQDWNWGDRALSWVQRGGQYFNIKPLARIRKPKLQLEDEARIYASSRVAINVHEHYQREFGGDCNERTFKIPLCGGFEVVDNVACIRKYFSAGTEMAIAASDREWAALVRHYASHPEERAPLIEAGRRRVLESHTYHHRAEQMLALAAAKASNS